MGGGGCRFWPARSDALPSPLRARWGVDCAFSRGRCPVIPTSDRRVPVIPPPDGRGLGGGRSPPTPRCAASMVRAPYWFGLTPSWFQKRITLKPLPGTRSARRRRRLTRMLRAINLDDQHGIETEEIDDVRPRWVPAAETSGRGSGFCAGAAKAATPLRWGGCAFDGHGGWTLAGRAIRLVHTIIRCAARLIDSPPPQPPPDGRGRLPFLVREVRRHKKGRLALRRLPPRGGEGAVTQRVARADLRRGL